MISAPSSVTAQQNQATALTGANLVSISDSIAANNGETVAVVLADNNGLLSATGSGVSGAGTKQLTITGSLSQVNSDLATLSDQDGSTAADTITIVANDSGGGTATAKQIAVSVNPAAPPPGNPVISSPSSLMVQQNQATALTGANLVSISDSIAASNGETVAVVLADNNGLLSATGSGVSGAGTKQLTITGSLSQVNSDLATLSDQDSSTAADTITIAANDSGGSTATAKQIAVSVNPAAPPPGNPVISAPSSVTAQQNQATALTGANLVSISDSIAANNGETVAVVLADNNGLLSATGSGVSGAGTKQLTITGSLSQVNSDLATLSDQDGSTAADTITIVANDSGGGTATAKQIAVSVNPAAPPPGNPVISSPSSLMVQQNQATALTGANLVSISDSIAASNGETVAVVLADNNGLLSATGSGVSGAGTKQLTITGSLSQVNSDLATLSDQDSSTAADTITIAANDSGGSTATAKQIAVSVNPAAPPPGNPVISAPSSVTAQQNQATALTGANLVSISDSIAANNGETVAVVLADNNGLLSATGSGVSGAGTKQLTITGSLSQVNSDLATLSDQDGSTAADTITIVANDSGGGTATAKQIAVSVNPAAPPPGNPVISSPSSLMVQQNQATALTGANLVSISDSIAASNGETVAVVLADNNGLLSATGSGVSGAGTKQLTITGSLSQVNSDLATLSDQDSSTAADTITIAANDSGGSTATAKQIAVSVNPANVPPSITAPSSAIVQQSQLSTISGISISDSDAVSANETIAVILSDTSGLFSATINVAGGGGTISGIGTTSLSITGTLAQVNSDLTTLSDQENSIAPDTIRINAGDSRGGTATAKQVAVSVTPAPPPAPSGLLLSPSADSGVQGDGITDVKTPTIIGFGVAGDTVTLDDGATAISQTNVGPNGNWSIVTTPLALGAHSLTATESDSGGNVSPASSPLPLSIVQSPAVDDFNGDGTSDMLTRAGTSLTVYDFNAGNISGFQPLGGIGTEWSIVGIGDFNGDGTSDMLMRAGTSLTVYDFNNGNISGFQPLGGVGTEWSVAGIGDFNGDGTSDMLMRAGTSLTVYDFNNGNISGFQPLGGVGTEWSVAGIGDFNGDGTSDMLMRAGTSLTVYDFKNGNISGFQPLGGVGTEWSIVGIGDFNGDGTSDMLMRAGTSLAVYDFNAAGNISGYQTLGGIGTEWSIVGIGDFNDDGTSDMLVRAGTALRVYDFKGGNISGYQDLGGIGTEWSVALNNSTILLHPV